MTDSFISPTVHTSKSVKDAIVMLDSRVPLTHQEKRLIAQSLYDLAFREGAWQGRQAGVDAVHAEIRTMVAEYRGEDSGIPLTFRRSDVAAVLETLLPPSEPREYIDPTVVIRENLAKKAQQRSII